MAVVIPNHLQTGEVSWGDDPDKRIYIQPVYDKFFDFVQTYLDEVNGSFYKVLRICGSPVIGKTTFLYYLLYQLKLAVQ
jgi:hypothetical protein